MSRLQNLVNSLVTVILNYTDPKRLKGLTAELLLQKSHEELIKDLTQLIKEATAIYETRCSLLNYFLYELNTLKPLADNKPEPLSEIELNRIKTHLVDLISNTQKLLKIEKVNFLPVNYNEEDREATAKISGFIDGGTLYSSTCRSGQVIQLWHGDISIFPIDSLKNVPSFLDHIVNEHHTALLLPHLVEENRKLKAVNTRLSESVEGLQSQASSVSELREKFHILEEREKQLAEENSRLQEEHALMLKREEASRVEAESLRSENTRLQDENVSLTSLQKDHTRLSQENASLTAANNRFRQSLIGRPFLGMTGLGPHFFAPGILNNPAFSTSPAPQSTEKKELKEPESPQFL